ncbi:TipAS antibiotic-recognition domain-containing protein [Streptomyces hydrogenans]|uniref:TipAS antibiotic-recognition domain-containing protein n=1 Tax=Streptomyces hydrogenans TaxID=1873719 RepID=UPI00382A7576
MAELVLRREFAAGIRARAVERLDAPLRRLTVRAVPSRRQLTGTERRKVQKLVCRPDGCVSSSGLYRQLIIDGRSMSMSAVSRFHRRGDATTGSSAVGNSYEDECRRSLAEEQAKSLAETNDWEHVDRERVHQDWDVLYREITGFMDGGSLPGDQQIQELVRRHFNIVCRFYTPSKKAYVGMSLFYAEDEAMRAFHDSYHPGLVEFLGAAISVFAEQEGGFAPSTDAQISA